MCLLCRNLNVCIDRLSADQLDTLKLASAPLPALLRDTKIVANNKKVIWSSIEKYENNKWSQIGFEGGETDCFQADDGDKENGEE